MSPLSHTANPLSLKQSRFVFRLADRENVALRDKRETGERRAELDQPDEKDPLDLLVSEKNRFKTSL